MSQSTTTSYPVPPPGYQAGTQPSTSSSKAYGATNDASGSAQDPLLSGRPRGDDPFEDDDIPEDFKIGVTVSQSSQDVRMAFVRKVYVVLGLQILSTVIVGGLLRTDSASQWTREHSGLMLIPLIGAFASMFGAFWKRHSHPLNLIFLSTFTLCEALTVGSVVSYYQQVVVLQALLITLGLFIGLTLFTLQSRYDFDNLGPYLFGALIVFFVTGIVQIFVPFSNTMDLIMAGVGVLLFSLYVVYDTHLLMNRLHVDDWIIACISLYLDLLNLFLQVLRLLSDIQDR